MPDELQWSGVLAKLDRADAKIDRLNKEIGQFLREEPYAQRVEYRDDGWTYLIVSVGKRPPIEWSVDIGEICHDLRSALDQLITLLRPNPDKYTGFPVYLSRTLYETRGRQGAECRISGVSDAVRTRIERLQPFRAGCDQNPLWALHELNRIDKHQTLLVSLARIHLVSGEALGQRQDFDPPMLVHDGTADVGTDIHFFRWKVSGNVEILNELPPEHSQAHLNFRATIVFNDAGPATEMPVIPVLKFAAKFTRRTVMNLARYLT